jgi:hypothetical protein
MGIQNVVALINPRAYFLALAAAVNECDLQKKWILFRMPAHPRHLIPAVGEVAPMIRAITVGEGRMNGGIYHIPKLYPFLESEEAAYRDKLPNRWGPYGKLPGFKEVEKTWTSVEKSMIARSW